MVHHHLFIEVFTYVVDKLHYLFQERFLYFMKADKINLAYLKLLRREENDMQWRVISILHFFVMLLLHIPWMIIDCHSSYCAPKWTLLASDAFLNKNIALFV